MVCPELPPPFPITSWRDSHSFAHSTAPVSATGVHYLANYLLANGESVEILDINIELATPT